MGEIPITVKACLAYAKELKGKVDTPRLDIEVILSWVLNKDRSFLFTWPEHALSVDQAAQFYDAFKRREAGEPIAHIIGEREFWSLPLFVNASTLIPRPDTEILVEVALTRLIEANPAILDLGTGTGAIAIALATERKDSVVLAVDNSASAVELAKKNVARHAIENVSVMQSAWFDGINLSSDASHSKFDLIVSNPPYIDENDPHLTQGDVVFEPLSALVAAENGLADILTICQQAPLFLNLYGWLVIEHGWTQGEQVRSIFIDNCFQYVETVRDYGGNERVTIGRFDG